LNMIWEILEALIQSIGRPSNASSHGVGSFQNATIILRISESKKEDSIAAELYICDHISWAFIIAIRQDATYSRSSPSRAAGNR
jgi:hypothetical protein